MSNTDLLKYRIPFLCLIAAGLVCSPAFAQQPDQMQTGGTATTLPITPQVRRPQNAAGLPNGPLTAVPEDFSRLRLAPGFLLDIEVYDEPEFSTQIRIDDNGNVTLPLVGSIHLQGKQIADAESAIEKSLRDKQILKNPQVTINVEQYTAENVTVLGEVQSPGRLQLLAPHNLLDVIAMAGGETNLAGDTIRVQHAGQSNSAPDVYNYSAGSNGDSIRNVFVKPGDTVTVERAGIVYVFGAVNRPGGYVMQEDGKLDVAQAISLALGTTMQAKTGGLRVIRHMPDGSLKTIHLSYKDIADGKAKPLPLEAQDIVYVPVSKWKAVLGSTTNIMGQTSSAAIYVAH